MQSGIARRAVRVERDRSALRVEALDFRPDLGSGCEAGIEEAHVLECPCRRPVVGEVFRLAQHLGLSGMDIRALGRRGVAIVFDCLAKLTENKAGNLWLLAYERHYREQILTALAANHGRGRCPDGPSPRHTGGGQ